MMRMLREFMIIFQKCGLCLPPLFSLMGQKRFANFMFPKHSPRQFRGILSTWGENVWLASNGGGIGTYWGEVRSIEKQLKSRTNFWHNSICEGYGFINFSNFSDR